MKWHTSGNLRFLTFDVFERHFPVYCVATTRVGGCSTGAYASLNLGSGTGDDPAAVRENRARLGAIAGAPEDRLTFGRQVHGNNVAVVDPSLVGSGSAGGVESIPDTDAMVTDVPEAPLVVLVADCCTVALYDPVNKSIGLAHAGWRGTAAGIAASLVEEMAGRFGSDPGELLAGIGPSIGRCCYEVGEDVLERFGGSFPRLVDQVFDGSRNGKAFLDLQRANRLILASAGVRDDRIETAGLCTACRTDLFYSHRTEHGRTGRSGVLITLRDVAGDIY